MYKKVNMNIIRLPPRSGSRTKRSSLYSDLSTINLYCKCFDKPHQVTFCSKQKQFDGNNLIKKELFDMSNQMSCIMTYFNELNKNQRKNLNKFYLNVTVIKENKTKLNLF